MTSLVFVVFEAAMQLCSLTFLVTTLILMSPARTSAESDFNTGCSGFSVTFRFLIDEDVVYEHVLEGHVYRRSTVTKATECHGLCRDDCRCVSMNYITNSEYDNCELNEANRHLEPASLRPKTGARYYELVRQYMVGVSYPLRCLKVLLSIHTDSEIIIIIIKDQRHYYIRRTIYFFLFTFYFLLSFWGVSYIYHFSFSVFIFF